MKRSVISLAFVCGGMLLSQTAMGFFCFSFGGNSSHSPRYSGPQYAEPQPFPFTTAPQYQYVYQPYPPAYPYSAPQYSAPVQPVQSYQPATTTVSQAAASQAIYHAPAIQNGIIQQSNTVKRSSGFID